MLVIEKVSGFLPPVLAVRRRLTSCPAWVTCLSVAYATAWRGGPPSWGDAPRSVRLDPFERRSALALAIGAAVAGRGKGNRRAVALSTGERASGLALLIAVYSIGDPVAVIAIVAFAVCMLVVNMATAAWAGRSMRRPHPAIAES